MHSSPFAPARPSAGVGVYRITGPGRVYVGSSDDIPRRWKSHLSQLRGGRHHNYRLQTAWDEHGEAAFVFTIIEEVADPADLVAAEQRQLNAALAAGPVYNLALDVSTPARGLVHTAESRLKMSVAIKASMTPERLAAMRERVNGSNNPGAKLTDALVVDICQRLMAGGHPALVAAEFQVTESVIYQIRRGQIWTHLVTSQTVATMMAVRQNSWANREITQEMRDRFRAVGEANKGKSLSPVTRAKISVHSRGETNPNAKVTEIQAAQIKGLLDAGARCEDVGPAFGISAGTVSRIKNGQAWPHVVAAPVPAEWEYLLAIPARPAASPEHRTNISAALKGKPESAAHRTNLWANRQGDTRVRAAHGAQRDRSQGQAQVRRDAGEDERHSGRWPSRAHGRHRLGDQASASRWRDPRGRDRTPVRHHARSCLIYQARPELGTHHHRQLRHAQKPG